MISFGVKVSANFSLKLSRIALTFMTLLGAQPILLTCKYLPKAMIRSNTSQNLQTNLDQEDTERKAELENAIASLRLKYPQAEFQLELSRIYERLLELIIDPAISSNKLPLVVMINALPGTGAVNFAQDVSNMPAFFGRQSWFKATPNATWLDPSTFATWGVPKETSDKVFPFVQVVEDYSLLNVSGNRNEMTIETSIEEKRIKSAIAELSQERENLFKVKSKVLDYRPMMPKTQEDTDNSSRIYSLFELLRDLDDNAASPLLTGFNRLEKFANRESENPMDASSLKAKSAAYFDAIFSQRSEQSVELGRGEDYIAALTNSIDKIKRLKVTIDLAQHSLDLKKRKLSELELIRLQGNTNSSAYSKLTLSEVELQISVLKDQLEEISEPDPGNFFSGFVRYLKRPAELQILQDANMDLMSLNSDIFNKIKDLSRDYPQFQETLEINSRFIKKYNDSSRRSLVKQNFPEKKGLRLNRNQEDFIDSAIRRKNSAGFIAKIVYLTTLDPQIFLNAVKDFFAPKKTNTERVFGNGILFLLSEYPELTASLIKSLPREKQGCISNPDCFRAEMQNFLKSSAAKSTLNAKLKNAIFWKPSFDDMSFELAKIGIDANSPPFVLPPSSADFKTWIEQELKEVGDHWIEWQELEDHIPVNLNFSESLKELAYFELAMGSLGSSLTGRVLEMLLPILLIDFKSEFAKNSLNASKESSVLISFDKNETKIVAEYKSNNSEHIWTKSLNLHNAQAAAQAINRILDDSLRNHFAAFMAGEVGITTLMWRNAPSGELVANVSQTGEFLSSHLPEPNWEVSKNPGFVQWAHLIMWMLGGSAGEVMLAPGTRILPESYPRLNFLKSEISRLFAELRREGFKRSTGKAPQHFEGAPFLDKVLLRGAGSKRDISRVPILHELGQFENQTELSEEDILAVYHAALEYSKDLIGQHPKLFKELLKWSVELMDPNHPRGAILPVEVGHLLRKEFPFKVQDVLAVKTLRNGASAQILSEADAARTLQKRNRALASTQFLFGVERFQRALRVWENTSLEIARSVTNSILP